ncbi:hypothetical protein [Pseudoxanthomonas sacheonensis]|uniref:Carboxypeptidase regulatory-like domain-containing protein n=1 Tax=Pseudoxanthomonas sacheonensis TaxID=443615 RepID=A0ABU1RRV4_9GAMM|nr:hypothetical protein [Pseudoxanthomonas sacheonensis]MDR6841507.1 hypothetical protein [Pseudoxanthomonas sacheonensis]
MRYLLLIFAVAITGCNKPGRVVEGLFTVDGKPTPGVEVRLPNNIDDYSDCGGAPLAAVTDQSGKFRASIDKYPIRPCFTVNGKIYSDFMIVDDKKQDAIQLRCRIPNDPKGHFEDAQVCF